ncbi:hypothetical protein WJX73_000125 [Symbiochloris irregularis]|uniref:Dynamin N-terminal domain-containing protein n=1 Tax=Symbiochloris irregularis TaxID=706552 RepID=A0AAW1PMR0_9CHLO
MESASECIAVLALTKSGKSTLLNSLIGEVILPSTNVPETARISTIQHAHLGPGEHPTLTYTLQDRSTHIVKSSSAIYDKLRWLNLEKRGRAHQLSDETPLEIRTRIAALETVSTAPKDISLKLLDTPGPNEAGEESLRYQVERLLETVDIVVYLLDWTKLKTQEEADLLKRLRDINPQLFARLSTRLFFCVNKADAIETSEGMDAEGTKEYVAELITRQLQHESFQLQPEQVILVSARDALLSRLVLGDKANKTDLTRFRQLAFGRRASAKSDEQMRAKADEMLQDSGVLELERRIFSFLYGHSAPLKLLSCIDDCERLLHQVQNVALASHASLQADMSTLQATISRLQGELGSVLGEFSTLQDEAQQIEGVVVDEVQARMQDLKERLFSHVAAVLEATEDSPAAVRVRSGRWKGVWDKALRFLRRESVTHSDGEAAEIHNADLQATLEELHNDIQEQISAEVAEFWHEVELALNVRQQSMFRAVNAHLERLSRAVEDVVGGLLSLRLEPVVVRMEPPSATEFHTSLQQLFSAGIGRQQSEVVRERTEDFVKWEKQHRGLCRHEYWVGVPSQRTVAEVYNETTFRLEPAKIKEHFMAQVEGRVAASTTYARAFVHQYVAGQISRARKNIEGYAEQYSQTMRDALNTQMEGEAARRLSAARVEAHLKTMTRLLAQAEGLTAQSLHSDQDEIECSEQSAPAVLPAEFVSLDLGSPAHEAVQPSDDSAKGSQQDGSSDAEDWLVVEPKSE